MDYIQSLFSFFNAPLFAIFILGLFWKRMSGTAGWTGLVAGTVSAVTVDVLVRTGVIAISSQAGAFVGASAAFVIGIAVSAAVTMVTAPKPEAELVGLTWSLTPRADRGGKGTGEDAGWYRSPVLLAVVVAVITVALYLVVP
jgi:solute:Na+ symporter, SSS family